MSKNILNITLRDFAGPFSQFITNLLGDDGETWWTAFKRFLRKENPWETVKTAKNVFTDMIAAGNYGWVNSNITEARFPVPGNLVLGGETKVFHFDRCISSENAIAEMGSEWRPANFYELLDYGIKNPDEQRKYPIIALGSVAVIDGYRCVAYLRGSAAERGLNLDRFDFGWLQHCRFLAVRK